MHSSVKEALGAVKENLKRLKLAQTKVPKLKDVKTALRKLQKIHHPDKNLDSSADG